MSYKRRTGHTTTAIAPGDPRVAGDYEQTADWPSVASLYANTARAISTRHSVTMTGLVEAPGSLTYSDLVDLAVVGPGGTVGVPLADLLAHARLMSAADVLAVRAQSGDSLAVPVRDALRTGAQLTLGSTRAALSYTRGGPVKLDVPGWTIDTDPLTVTAIRALTFEEFVSC